jgi:hypothetical protein
MAERRDRPQLVPVQLSHDQAELERALGEDATEKRRRLLEELDLDDRIFIPGYGLVFAASCVLLGLRDFAAAVPLAVLAGLAAAASVALDLAENRRTRAALATAPADDRALADARVRSMRAASLRKWTFVSTTTALFCASFLERGGWWSAIGALYLAAGALGLATVVANLGATARASIIRAGFVAVTAANLVGLGFAIALALG